MATTSEKDEIARLWAEQHPDARDLANRLKAAQEKLTTIEWCNDPIEFFKRHETVQAEIADARAALEAAKKPLLASFKQAIAKARR
ncbi:MAG: hypothetical protein ACLP1X_35330 [Polyangiaceae bacterium]